MHNTLISKHWVKNTQDYILKNHHERRKAGGSFVRYFLSCWTLCMCAVHKVWTKGLHSSDFCIVSSDMGQTVPYLPPNNHEGLYFPNVSTPIYALILRSSISLANCTLRGDLIICTVHHCSFFASSVLLSPCIDPLICVSYCNLQEHVWWNPNTFIGHFSQTIMYFGWVSILLFWLNL